MMRDRSSVSKYIMTRLRTDQWQARLVLVVVEVGIGCREMVEVLSYLDRVWHMASDSAANDGCGVLMPKIYLQKSESNLQCGKVDNDLVEIDVEVLARECCR